MNSYLFMTLFAHPENGNNAEDTEMMFTKHRAYNKHAYYYISLHIYTSYLNKWGIFVQIIQKGIRTSVSFRGGGGIFISKTVTYFL